MSTDTIKLYNVLIDQGADRDRAREALEPILTKDEAYSNLATKEDMHRQTKWIVSIFLAAVIGQIGVMTVIVNSLLKSAL